MPFNIGLSGINAAHADLKTTGNNIANAGTIGFKASRAEFANVYALSKSGAAATAIGSGVRVGAIAQQFTQGNTSFTANNLDMSVNGEGFFNLIDNAGTKVYSRNGQFKVDQNGFIANNQGQLLQGYQVDVATNVIDTGRVGNLQLTTAQIDPVATTTTDLFANIDSGAAILGDPNAATPVAPPAIDPDTPSTYTHTTSYTTYDSLGNPMLTSMYFQKTNNNAWTVGVRTVDAAGVAMPADTVGPPLVKNTDNFLVTFDTAGKLSTIADAATPATLLYDNTGQSPVGTAELILDYGGTVATPTGNPTPTGAAEQTIALNIANITQFGANFSVNNLTQNGYATGNLSGIEVDPSGVILARFTNGEAKNMGQLVLSSFANEQGLGQVGNNGWVRSFKSGAPVDNVPGAGGLGQVQSGSLEEANINLTEELIRLITAQRNFQANAKTITTADQIAQTIIQI